MFLSTFFHLRYGQYLSTYFEVKCQLQNLKDKGRQKNLDHHKADLHFRSEEDTVY